MDVFDQRLRFVFELLGEAEHELRELYRPDYLAAGSAQLGGGGVGLGRGVFRRLGPVPAVGHGDEVGGDVIA